MNFNFSPDDVHTFLPKFGQQAGATIYSDWFESILTLPRCIGEGAILLE